MTSNVLPMEIQSKILLLREPHEYVKGLKEIIVSVKLFHLYYNNDFKTSFEGRKTSFNKSRFTQIKTIYQDAIASSNLLPSQIKKLRNDVERIYIFIQENRHISLQWKIKDFKLSKLRKNN